MPSRVTAVPGSQGPRQSGSVMVEALQVPTHASAFPLPDVDDPVGLEEAAVGAGCTPLTRRVGFVTATRVTPPIRFVAAGMGWAAARTVGGGLGSGTF